MVKTNKKLWAHYEELRTILGIYITLFFIVPILSLCFSCLVHSAEIDEGIQDAIKNALLSGLKWYAIIMPLVTVIFAIWFLYSSDRVELSDKIIKYYRFIFSKNARNIPIDEITECVVCGRLWNDKREYTRKRRIVLYHKKHIIIEFDIYSKLALMLVLSLSENRFKLVSEKGNLNTISNYYKIDFMALNSEDQLKILKYYCKLNYAKYKTGEEILQIR